jgi:hypothetical protein
VIPFTAEGESGLIWELGDPEDMLVSVLINAVEGSRGGVEEKWMGL